MLWPVRVPWRQKLMLMALFSLTVVVMIVSVIRVAVVNSTKKNADISWLYLWSGIEMATCAFAHVLLPPSTKAHLLTSRRSHHHRVPRIIPPIIRHRQSESTRQTQRQIIFIQRPPFLFSIEGQVHSPIGLSLKMALPQRKCQAPDAASQVGQSDANGSTARGNPCEPRHRHFQIFWRTRIRKTTALCSLARTDISSLTLVKRWDTPLTAVYFGERLAVE